MKFCGHCGGSLVLKVLAHTPRACCPQCGSIHSEQLKVGAGALIERDKALLLTQRTKAPFAQCWNLPAGYVEVAESPTQAVVREVSEEVGLQVTVAELVGVYYFDDDPRGNGILIVYRCDITGGVVTESDEATAPTFCASQDIPRNLAGGGHNQAISAWQALRV
jgi:ADP-ribose pyrophosphatase YjhB (NUDIX family)